MYLNKGDLYMHAKILPQMSQQLKTNFNVQGTY